MLNIIIFDGLQMYYILHYFFGFYKLNKLYSILLFCAMVPLDAAVFILINNLYKSCIET